MHSATIQTTQQEIIDYHERLLHKVKSHSLTMLSGGLSGAISRCAVAPMERIIILRQTRNVKYFGQSIPEMLINMKQAEGIKSWFKGNGANCLKIAPFQSIEFFSFEFYSFYLQQFVKTNDTVKYLLCGGLAGITASSVVYPIDLVKTILAVQIDDPAKQRASQYKGIFGTMKQIRANTGILSLYRGWGATVLGIAPYASLKLTCYQTLKNLVYGKDIKSKDMNTITNLGLGSAAGCFAVTMTYPTDLIRRRLQIDVLKKDSQITQKMSLIKMGKRILQKEGFKGLYAGMGATYLKVIPSTAIVFALNEKLKQVFKVQNHKI